MIFSRNFIAICGILFCFGILGCKKVSDPEVKDVPFGEVKPPAMGFKPPDLSHFKQRVSERFAAGDTIPLEAKKLAKLLPAGIEDYSLDISQAQKFVTRDFAFSEATNVFYDDRSEYLEITLSDYIGDTLFFESPLRRYNLLGGPEFGPEKAEKLTEGLGPNGFGWVSFDKSRGLATLFLGIDYRYALHIEATGQANWDRVRAVRDAIHMEELPGAAL